MTDAASPRSNYDNYITMATFQPLYSSLEKCRQGWLLITVGVVHLVGSKFENLEKKQGLSIIKLV